jgi:nucleoside-diphosphate kinase
VEERTLVLIKPDAVNRNVWFDIMRRYLEEGLEIDLAQILTMDEAMAREFYAEHVGRDYFQGLIDHMISGPIIAMIVSGANAVQRVRRLNGATNPVNAKEGTIRRKYGQSDGGPKNAVHGSDSAKSFERECAIIFK